MSSSMKRTEILVLNNRDVEKLTAKLTELKIFYFVTESGSNLSFKNSCFLCCKKWTKLQEKYYKIIDVFVTNDEFDEIAKISKVTKYFILCTFKLSLEMNCPFYTKQKQHENLLSSNLVNYLEGSLQNDGIKDCYDILISMDKYGWFPIFVLLKKLQGKIIIKEKTLLNALKYSKYFQVSDDDMYTRRVDPVIPYNPKERQFLINGIPHNIKNIEQFESDLDNSNVKVLKYNYKTRSALCSSLDEIVDNFVKNAPKIDNLNVYRIIPNIDEDFEIQLQPEERNLKEVNHLLNCLDALVLKENENDTIHIRRFKPDDLDYEWPKVDWTKPDISQIQNILKQVEFYFSDENLIFDLKTLKEIKDSTYHWIPVNMIFNYKLANKLCGNDIHKLTYALCYSDRVEISYNGLHIRRRVPLMSWDKNYFQRLLFIWNLPNEIQSDHERILVMFKDEARLPVNMVRCINTERVPPVLAKVVPKVPGLQQPNKTCTVIELETDVHVLAARDYLIRRCPYAAHRILTADGEHLRVPKSIDQLSNPIAVEEPINKLTLEPSDDEENKIIDSMANIQLSTHANTELQSELVKHYSQQRKMKQVPHNNKGRSDNKQHVHQRTTNHSKKKVVVSQINIKDTNEFPALGVINNKGDSKPIIKHNNTNKKHLKQNNEVNKKTKIINNNRNEEKLGMKKDINNNYVIDNTKSIEKDVENIEN